MISAEDEFLASVVYSLLSGEEFSLTGIHVDVSRGLYWKMERVGTTERVPLVFVFYDTRIVVLAYWTPTNLPLTNTLA